jgi:protein-S-isoprenylcysteine O-methyltransferase Ste14
LLCPLGGALNKSVRPKLALVLRGKKGEYLVVLQFVLVFAFVFVPPWNPLLTPPVMAETHLFRWLVVLSCGLAALLLGGIGVLHIREYLTPLPYPVDHNRLVDRGAYGIVRHPLYSSQLLAGLGWTLFQLSFPHLLLLITGFFFFDYKAAKEEGWLVQRHPEYEEYARRVRKLIPWVY